MKSMGNPSCITKDETQSISGNKNLILVLAVILLAPAFSSTAVSKIFFDRMTCYHSKKSTGRLFTNEKGHLVWQCRKPDQLVAHLQAPMDISHPGDVAEFCILWKSSGQVLGPDCRRKLCHDDCVICLAGTGDFRMGLFDSSGGRRVTRDGEGLESDVFKGWRGYQWRFSPHLQAGEPKRWYEPKPDGSRESHTNTRFWKRVKPDDRSLLASRNSWSTMGYEPFAGGFNVPQNEFRLLSFKIKRQSDTHVAVSITLNGKTFTRTDSDPNNQPEKIDSFAIHMPNARPYHMVVLAPADGVIISEGEPVSFSFSAPSLAQSPIVSLSTTGDFNDKKRLLTLKFKKGQTQTVLTAKHTVKLQKKDDGDNIVYWRVEDKQAHKSTVNPSEVRILYLP